MDKQEYLNQISASNRPNKASKLSEILSSKFFWIGVIGIGAFIIILIIGSLLGGKKSTKDEVTALILHINNTSEVIENYQQNVKSSGLRAYSATLKSVLSDASRDLTIYAADKYNFGEEDPKESLIEEEAIAREELESELFEAKINGILDRIYAHKMAYEIYIITDKEAQLLKSTDDETLEAILNTSYNNLDLLYSKFDEFSETK